MVPCKVCGKPSTLYIKSTALTRGWCGAHEPKPKERSSERSGNCG